MASEETRRILKVFGIAVTDFEDAIEKGASPEEVAKVDTELRVRLGEITALIDRLRAQRN